MLGWNWLTGQGASWGLIVTVLLWFLTIMSGCSVTSWDAEATQGTHRTTWNHGLEIGFSGWGMYIGPGRNSTTSIENEFTAAAQGTGQDEEDQTDSTDVE